MFQEVLTLSHGTPLVLLADDSNADCKVMEIALKRLEIPCVLKTVADGEALIHTLKSEQRPALILLDLNLPIKSGLEALQEIKSDPSLKSIPVIVWSTSENPADVRQSYLLGASSFFIKPDSFDKVIETMRVVIHYWLRAVKLPQPGVHSGLKS